MEGTKTMHRHPSEHAWTSVRINGNYLKQCKIVNKGGKGDGDEYSEGKENAEDGIVRIDVLNEKDYGKIKQTVKCSNVYYGNFK